MRTAYKNVLLFLRILTLPKQHKGKKESYLLDHLDILGPHLVNSNICDMFFEAPTNLAFVGYEDDNTPYTY